MDVISHFLDNIKQKTTNPFIGTLIGVWLVRNWELVYTLFNFDDGCLLADKKKFVWDYYQDKDIWIEFLTNFGYALAFLIIGYIFIIISRIILNVVYHKIIPFLNSKTVSSLVVDNARFETVKKSRDEYFKKIGELEEERIQLEQKNSLLNSKNIELLGSISLKDSDLKELNNNLINLTNERNDLNKKNVELSEEKSKLIDDINSLIKNVGILTESDRKLLLNSNIDIKNDYYKYVKKVNSNTHISLSFSDEFVKAVNYLKENGKEKDFLEKAYNLQSGYSVIKKDLVKYNDVKNYITVGLIERVIPNLDKNESDSSNTYKLTDLGKMVLKYRVVFD